jgi:phage shock protein PspC (stress-responsive transcriptional regulator)
LKWLNATLEENKLYIETNQMERKMNEKRLVRVEEGRMIAGVCTGLARYLGVDATVVRLIFVLLALFAAGGVLLYLILWIIMPMEEAA